MLQHDGSFHDIFFDYRSDTNSRILRNKNENLIGERVIVKRKKNIKAVSLAQFIITQVDNVQWLSSWQHYYTVFCITLFRTLLHKGGPSNNC